MAEALGVSVVTKPVFPYAETPPIDVVMSHMRLCIFSTHAVMHFV